MKSKNIILLKALLKSTSLWNIRKYTTDKKKKGRCIAGFVGRIVLFIMLCSYSFTGVIGLGMMGMADTIPGLYAISVSAIAFFFTVFKTNGYLFNFKEYDMLMALPFKVKDVAACKFLYMYVKSVPWYLSLSISMMIGYGIFSKASFVVYPVWLILGLFVPVIPMLAASFFGFLIAKVSAGFEKKNVIQTVLTLIFVMFCFSLQYIIDAVFKNDMVEDIAIQTSEITEKVATYYFPAGLFFKAVLDISTNAISGLVYGILLVAVTVFLYEVIFYFVGKYYRQINSALKSHVAKKNYKVSGLKRKSVVNAIAYKEFKRFTGSTNYFVNAGMGVVLAVIASVAVLVVGFDKVISVVTKGAPIPEGIMYPAIPLMVYFLVGMMSTTTCSPSLEGKNYWILQSLPLSKKTIYQGKMLFNLYLTVPVMSVAILCFSISAHLPVINMVLFLILGFFLCTFSTAWGCVCGIKHMRLDWENEIEVIKQGTAVVLYLLPNMFVTMGLVVLVVWLGTKIDTMLITLVLIAVAAFLSALSYVRVLKLAKE